MDELYRQENIEVFKRWVYFQIINDQRLTLQQSDSCTYQIYYEDKVAYFVIWPIGVIEESIYQGEKLLFYLHYQFYNFRFAVDLYHRMIDKLIESKSLEKHRVLLCCSGGMTTGFFAEKMNTYCKLNQLPYQLNASPIYQLDHIYQDYDLILIAPQLRYKVNELAEKYQPTVVQSIDAVTFATYNCQLLLSQIESFYKGVNV